jgi:small subunit ribosomal protein S19e
MATVKDIPADKFIAALAAKLEESGKFPQPKNADLLKLSRINELAPLDEKWYYVRLAAVFRRIYIQQGCGVGHLTRAFGGAGRTRNELATSKTLDCARGNIRFAMKQLETSKYIAAKKGKNGRFITDSGRRFMDSIAKSLTQ